MKIKPSAYIRKETQLLAADYLRAESTGLIQVGIRLPFSRVWRNVAGSDSSFIYQTIISYDQDIEDILN